MTKKEKKVVEISSGNFELDEHGRFEIAEILDDDLLGHVSGAGAHSVKPSKAPSSPPGSPQINVWCPPIPPGSPPRSPGINFVCDSDGGGGDGDGAGWGDGVGDPQPEAVHSGD